MASFLKNLTDEQRKIINDYNKLKQSNDGNQKKKTAALMSSSNTMRADSEEEISSNEGSDHESDDDDDSDDDDHDDDDEIASDGESKTIAEENVAELLDVADRRPVWRQLGFTSYSNPKQKAEYLKLRAMARAALAERPFPFKVSMRWSSVKNKSTRAALMKKVQVALKPREISEEVALAIILSLTHNRRRNRNRRKNKEIKENGGVVKRGRPRTHGKYTGRSNTGTGNRAKKVQPVQADSPSPSPSPSPPPAPAPQPITKKKTQLAVNPRPTTSGKTVPTGAVSDKPTQKKAVPTNAVTNKLTAGPPGTRKTKKNVGTVINVDPTQNSQELETHGGDDYSQYIPPSIPWDPTPPCNQAGNYSPSGFTPQTAQSYSVFEQATAPPPTQTQESVATQEAPPGPISSIISKIKAKDKYNIKRDGKTVAMSKTWTYAEFRKVWDDCDVWYQFPKGPKNLLDDKDKYTRFLQMCKDSPKRILPMVWKHTDDDFIESSDEQPPLNNPVKAKLQKQKGAKVSSAETSKATPFKAADKSAMREELALNEFPNRMFSQFGDLSSQYPGSEFRTIIEPEVPVVAEPLVPKAPYKKAPLLSQSTRPTNGARGAPKMQIPMVPERPQHVNMSLSELMGVTSRPLHGTQPQVQKQTKVSSSVGARQMLPPPRPVNNNATPTPALSRVVTRKRARAESESQSQNEPQAPQPQMAPMASSAPQRPVIQVPATVPRKTGRMDKGRARKAPGIGTITEEEEDSNENNRRPRGYRA